MFSYLIKINFRVFVLIEVDESVRGASWFFGKGTKGYYFLFIDEKLILFSLSHGYRYSREGAHTGIFVQVGFLSGPLFSV